MGEKCTSCRSARNANNPQTLACLFSLKSKQGEKQTLIFPLPFVALWSLFWHSSSLSCSVPWFPLFSWHLAVPQPPFPLPGQLPLLGPFPVSAVPKAPQIPCFAFMNRRKTLQSQAASLECGSEIHSLLGLPCVCSAKTCWMEQREVVVLQRALL